MKTFKDKIAVITGAGDGMGRAIALQLTSEGCHIALADIFQDKVDETKALCEAQAPSGTKITAHRCDVSEEAQFIALRDEVIDQHHTQSINLLFNNAGVAGSESIINGSREDWERTFNINWFGVYYGTRTFLPLLIASKEARLVNTSSINGFWATGGTATPYSAYCASKHAVKGFTEALITDLGLNAPHVRVSTVFPGATGTGIIRNTELARGHTVDPELEKISEGLRESAPTSAAQAATIILDGIRADQWRILVGGDAAAVDKAIRKFPEEAYSESFFDHLDGHLAAMRQT